MRQKQLFAVAGNPILHSLSPTIMNAALKTAGINGKYLKLISSDVKDIKDTVLRLNMKGLSITAPYKNKIIPFLDEINEKAEFLAAVNAITYFNNKIKGYNTDVNGIIKCLQPYIKTKSTACVLGTGGASEAVCYSLDQLKINYTVIGRNSEKRSYFKQKFNCETDTYKNQKKIINYCNIIISSLPADVDVLRPEFLNKKHTVLDANYKGSVFEKEQKKYGYRFLSGKDWLINQAIPAFNLFTAKKTTYEIMEQAINSAKPHEYKRVSLIGFMGAGKTTIGKKLAEKLNYQFIDIDLEIEKEQNCSIREIFELKGEKTFRKMESQMLDRQLKKEMIVLSCGGGTILNYENRDKLYNNSLCLWLEGSIKHYIDNLDISNRPLLQNGDPYKIAKKLYNDRIDYYTDAAHAVVCTNNKTIEQISEKIYEEINKTYRI